MEGTCEGRVGGELNGFVTAMMGVWRLFGFCKNCFFEDWMCDISQMT